MLFCCCCCCWRCLLCCGGIRCSCRRSCCTQNIVESEQSRFFDEATTVLHLHVYLNCALGADAIRVSFTSQTIYICTHVYRCFCLFLCATKVYLQNIAMLLRFQNCALLPLSRVGKQNASFILYSTLSVEQTLFSRRWIFISFYSMALRFCSGSSGCGNSISMPCVHFDLPVSSDWTIAAVWINFVMHTLFVRYEEETKCRFVSTSFSFVARLIRSYVLFGTNVRLSTVQHENSNLIIQLDQFDCSAECNIQKSLCPTVGNLLVWRKNIAARYLARSSIQCYEYKHNDDASFSSVEWNRHTIHLIHLGHHVKWIVTFSVFSDLTMPFITVSFEIDKQMWYNII